MSYITVLHNPQCSTSRAALEDLAQAGPAIDVVSYLTAPLTAEQLRGLLVKLEDPATDLVRRDSCFAELGLTEEDVATVEQVIQVLVEHPRLMQRPVLVAGERAIIGRPRDRVLAFCAEAGK